MDKNEFPTSKLFVIRPSIVICDTTNKKENMGRNIAYLNHIVRFETRTSDITVALKKTSCYSGIINNTNYQPAIGFHCIEGDLHVGVSRNDSVLLARYLWEKNMHTSKYCEEVEEYIIALKPFYTVEEIKQIVEQIKFDISNNKKNKSFVYEKKRQQPIFISNVYTDID